MSQQVDTRIVGGTVHTPSGPLEADVLISGETITGIVAREDQTVAANTINAAGLQVIPGLVDTHAHARTPGLEYKEDFYTVSQACAVGG